MAIIKAKTSLAGTAIKTYFKVTVVALKKKLVFRHIYIIFNPYENRLAEN
jgi:hypothetical protein